MIFELKFIYWFFYFILLFYLFIFIYLFFKNITWNVKEFIIQIL